eukprot:CAMPEP_0171066598 /NCGR_PEP_ID=MMETSP0766_2-20121228/7514_1 /TAXON_ID=439317 /ORGANISM="Gambierdiscus australes, Strain CAWD 149" /LENGTH=290 /DNA_ID=CAMNT_0011522783 /DNA_START=74 /DNA_END=942 /DNA_ORIENTATION=+
MHNALLVAVLVHQVAAAVSPAATGPNILDDYKALVESKVCEGSLVAGAPQVQQETLDGCALICSCLDGCAGVNFDVGVGHAGTLTSDATDVNVASGRCSFADACSAPANVSEGSKLVLKRSAVAEVSTPLLDCVLSKQPEANGYTRVGSGGPGPLKCTGFEGSDDATGDFYEAELGAVPSPETCASKCDATADCVAFVHHLSRKRCTFHKRACDTLIHGTESEDYYVKAESALVPMRRLWGGSGGDPTPTPTPSGGSGQTPSPTPTSQGGSGSPSPTPEGDGGSGAPSPT